MNKKKWIIIPILILMFVASYCSHTEQSRLALPTATVNVPANQNASPAARQVLDYFWRLHTATGNADRTIIGDSAGFADMEGVVQDYNANIEGINQKTGKYPGMMTLSYGYWSEEIDYHVAINRINPLIKNYWNKGGLIGIMPHYRNPLCANTSSGYSPTWGCGDNVVPITGTLSDILDPSKPAYTIMRNEMDRVAYGLQDLEDAGVVVLWRPFQEMNFGWYWQGKHEQDKFIALWRYEFDYLTRVKGLSNLLYVYGPNYIESWANEAMRKPTYYYPGDAYVDLVQLSIYDVDPSALNTNGGWDNARTINKPRGVFESGIPNPGSYDLNKLTTALKSFGDVTVWGLWPDWGLTKYPNPSIVMNGEWYITRDEIRLSAITPVPTIATNTAIPATQTSTATRTPVPETNTSIPPTKTPIPPTLTPQIPTNTRTATFTPTVTASQTIAPTSTFTQVPATKTFTPVPPSVTSTPVILTPTPDHICINSTWGRNLKQRPSASMSNIALDTWIGAYAQGIPIEEVVDNSEGKFAKINWGTYAAMYLNSNNRTYAVIGVCK